MQRKLFISIPAIIIASLFLANPAMADLKSPPPTSSNDARDIYNLALDKFKSDLKIYEDKRREINQNFKDSIEKALVDSKSATAGVKSQMQKRMTMNARQNAVTSATAIRDAAIEALGPAPVAPTPPAKAAKPEREKRAKPSTSNAIPQ